MQRLSLVDGPRRRMGRRAEPVALQADLGAALAAIAGRAVAAFSSKIEHLSGHVDREDSPGAHRIVAEATAAAERAVVGTEHVARPYAARVDAHSAREVAAQIQRATGALLAMPRTDPRRAAAFAADVERSMRKIVRELGESADKLVASMILAVRLSAAPFAARSRLDAEYPIEHALRSVDQISGLSKQQKDELGAELAAAHAAGDLTRATLRAVLAIRYGMLAHRAKFVARDQISRLNGYVDMDRQVALGITHFTWITRGDDRVRPLHVSRNGKIFSWADPPKTNGESSIPGHDPLCRCTADPVANDLREILSGSRTYSPPRLTR